MSLRPYQSRESGALGAIERGWSAGVRRQLVSLPTGTGKTVLFANLTSIGFRRLLVVAHREELLDQAAAKLRSWNQGLEVQVDQGDRWAAIEDLAAFDGDLWGGTGYAVCASVATIGRAGSRRLTRYPRELFDAVVIDEAHHASAQSYQSVIDHFRAGAPDGPLLLGVTATPFRADGADLSKIFDTLVFSLELPEAIEKGYLVDIRAVAVETKCDLDRVAATREDFRQGELEDAVNTPGRNGKIVKAYLERAAGLKGIVFAAGVQHSRDLCEAFRAAGVQAEHLDGTTPADERAAILRRLHTGETTLVCNVGVLTEGFDEPSISVVILARPTKSGVLYCVDSATEALTPIGWTPVRTLGVGSVIAAFQPATGSVAWEPVLAHVDRYLNLGERMYELKSERLDIRVTGQHRLVWRCRVGRKRSRSEWRISTADALADRSDGWEIPVAGQAEFRGVPLSADELRFVAWVQTDGSVNKANRAIVIGQSTGAPERCAEIERVLSSCGLKWRSSDVGTPTNFGPRSSPQRLYRISYGKPRAEDEDKRGWQHLERWLPKADQEAWARLDEMTADQFAVFLHALHLGDGSKQEGQPWTRRSYHIATGREEEADILQSMCVRRGWRCNVSRQGDSVWFVRAKMDSARTVAGTNSPSRPRLRRCSFHHDERVSCVSVPSGAFVTRRHGKVAILGNCQMVGRGTRLFAGKTDLLVIDVADVTSRHSLVRAAALFGIPSGIDLEGTSATAARKKVKKLVQEGLPFEELAKAQRLADLDAIANRYREIKLFWQPKPAPEVEGISQMAWVSAGDGELTLRAGELRAHIRIDLIGHAHLTITRRPPRTEQGQLGLPIATGPTVELDATFPRLSEAVVRADGHLRASTPRAFTDPKAKWRGDPASPKQLALLKRYRVPHRDGLTKGEAGILLDKVFARRAAHA